MTSTIHGARLSFSAESIETSLSEILARLPGGGERPKIDPPEIGVSATKERLTFEPVRDLALQEILLHARSGTAHVRLPLRPSTFRVGPLTLEIVPGAAALLDVAVEDGCIVFEACEGRIEPPVSLPLGFTFRGLYLDDKGQVHVDIGGLPDLNVSRLFLGGFRVPATLKEALAIAFDRAPKGEPPKAADEEGEPAPPAVRTEARDKPGIEIDLDDLVVEARGVTATGDPLVLGSLGRLTLGGGTRLDILYRKDLLAVSGQVDVEDATFSGEGFRVDGLRGRGVLAWRLVRRDDGHEVALEVHDGHAAVAGAALGLKDGTRFHVGASDLEALALKVEHGGGPLFFLAGAKRASGALTSGILMAHVAGRTVPVRIDDVRLEGPFEVAHDHFRVDLDVKSGRVAATGLPLDVGLLRLDVALLTATAQGRLRAGTDMGAAFSGALQTSIEVDDGAVRLGPIQAGLSSGTRGSFTVTDVAGGPDGLDALVADGEISLVVRSGSVPIGRHATLGFSRGAEGRLLLSKIDARRGAPFPSIEGRLDLYAQSDSCRLDPLLELPAGEAHVALGRFSLDDVGVLRLLDLEVELKSDAPGARVARGGVTPPDAEEGPDARLPPEGR